MKKKNKLLIISMLSMGLCASLSFVISNNAFNFLSADDSKPPSLSCSWYFNNGYQSLYDLNVKCIKNKDDESLLNAKTWGTITDTYYNTKGTLAQQYIQSTDQYGNVGATCLYGVSSEQVFPTGSVVTVTGNMTLYYGMSEMKNFTVELDYASNPYPVETMDIDYLPSSGDDSFEEYRNMGTREISLTNVTLGEVINSQKCYVTLPNNNQVLLYFKSIQETTAIINKINSLRGSSAKADIKGYLVYYSGESIFEVYVRHADDIKEHVPEKNMKYIYATTEKTFYYMDEVKISDFVVTAYYDDDTSSIVNNAYIDNIVDTSSLGWKTVDVAYDYKEETYHDYIDINIMDTITSISVSNPTQIYAKDEVFVSPTVYGKAYNYEIDISADVNFSGFDSSKPSEYQGSVTAEYTNSAERLISTSYDYYISDVTSLIPYSPKLQFELGESFDYPKVYATFAYSPYTQIDVSDRVSYSGFDSSAPGNVDISITLGAHEYIYQVEIIDNTPQELFEYQVSLSGIGNYNTGNYGVSDDFEYYRAVKQENYICKIIPLVKQDGCKEPLGGAIYNIDPIKDIDHITFTYKTSGSGSSSPSLLYGENSYDDGSVEITYSSSLKETTVNLSSYPVNYIKFDSGDFTLFLKEITIYYSGANTPHGSNFNYRETGDGEYRIAPVTYSGALVDGESYVDVPVAFDVTHSTVLDTKRYTYYSYQYVLEHSEVIDVAKMINPIDVCNYFQAFGCAPANYCCKGTVNPLRDGKELPSTSEVNELFGDDARCISQYSKTTGYARSVPYYGSKPTYYELDIDTNGYYSTSSRQVGRIVAWATGFDLYDYGYGSQCVCTFTDDHYSTFAEYNNYGGFLTRFGAEKIVNGYIRGNPITISY